MPLKRFQVEKLIRDRLPGILRQKGIRVQERVLAHDEWIASLKDKLLEEAREVAGSQSRRELIEELADVLEVLRAIAKATGVSLEEIEKTRAEKRDAKGGFDERIYNAFVELEEENPAISYYLQKPEHYPLIANSQKSDCLFCQIARREREAKLLEVFPHCYAIQDAFPVSNGHVLIIPNEHTENWFTAREEVRVDMIKALHLLKKRLDIEYNPHGYNIGMNCGEVAGQAVMHLHLHLIPRYRGDMENPNGGVRGVIPSKQKY